MSEEKDCQELICKDDPFIDVRHLLKPKHLQECPLTRQSLGNFSWSLMHTFAVYYPKKPTLEDQQSMMGFLKGFRNLFPCRHCKAHFQRDFDKGNCCSR
jgi:mitochondrial FAD-linked sulfhydryl oxidase